MIILDIKQAFCDMYNEDLYESTLKFYDSLGIKYKTGYKFKICVEPQLINVDIRTANMLLNNWPILDISYGLSKYIENLRININGIKESNDAKTN